MGVHRARLREKENLFRYRANFDENLLRFARARADDAKIVRSRDAQYNTKELPQSYFLFSPFNDNGSNAVKRGVQSVLFLCRS